MNNENQNTEFKRIWRDEFLKHVCAFANTQGGRIFIGLDDKGNIVGIPNAKKLLEDIPNKTVQFLGLVVDIELNISDNKDYLIIIVKQSQTPISYKGRYYLRSGSTIQELKDSNLQQFILKKLGKSYDELPLEFATIEDIDIDVVNRFIEKSTEVKRIALNASKDDINAILYNLRLLGEDNMLKNAALLLFGKNPSRFLVL